MAKVKKYYVVWEGHQPGIYEDWNQAQKQINGFKGARFKSYTNLTLAKQDFNLGYSSEEGTKKKSAKQKYYVVWAGHKPGIYTDWDSAKKHVEGFNKPKYKTFGSKQLAEQAFADGPENYNGNYKKTRDLSPEELAEIGQPLELALCVDAACNSKGDFEYRGVWNHSGDEVFRVGPYKKGSNNIGEFLALVHALAYLNKQRDPKMKQMPIYSDSRIAMKWVKYKHCRTNKQPLPEVQNLIERAEMWLNTNSYSNPILKWETKVWGEIPADFGRK